MSQTVRQQVDPTLSFAQLRANPEAYTDRMVMLGGDILAVRNVEGGTLLEILQKPLDSYERPYLTDHTEGRFMVHCTQYLDPVVYKKGREITVAGRVLGVRKGPIGEVEYTYPLLSCVELYLWPEPVPLVPSPYPRWYWDPWYWDRPWFWRPYYR
jgi:outer membrane lipoprotein